MSVQLGLPILTEPGFGEFLPATSNAEARAWLARPADWPDGRLALWGEEGTGKSHLLARFAQAHGALVRTPGDPGPDDAAAPLILDDAAPPLDEAALLHTLNRAGERGRLVLLAARTAPARWTVPLPDLASRLRAITAVALLPADDALLRLLLARLLAQRQLTVPESVQAYLLATLPRNGAALRDAVARLDETALARGGRIDRALAKG